MTRTTEEMVLFLASPSDLDAERAVCRAVTDRVNQVCGVNLGVRLRVSGWEDVPPGLGRPQALINPLVDECDTFVGILNRRWGSPTGTVESGFEEEFSRASARAAAGAPGAPAIALFFKRLSPADELDAGPQLTQLLTFRSRIRDEHLALYREFDDANDFERQLFGYLVNLVTSSHTSTPASEGSPLPRTAPRLGPPALSEAPPTDSAHGPDDAQRQLIDVLEAYAVALRTGEYSEALDPDRLISLSLAVGTGGLLQTHVANRLYLRRTELSVVAGESHEWARTVVADLARGDERETVIPGWFFVVQDDFPGLLARLIKDELWSVRQGVVSLLGWMRLRPPYLWPVKDESGDEVARAVEVWDSLLADLPIDSKVVSYLAGLATADDLALLTGLGDAQAAQKWKDEVGAVRSAVSGEPKALVEQLIRGRDVLAPAIALAEAKLDSLEPDALRAILNAKSGAVAALRLPAFELLSTRGLVDAAAVVSSVREDGILRDRAVQFVADHADREALADEVLSLLKQADATSLAIPRLLAVAASLDELRHKAEAPINDDEWMALIAVDPEEGPKLARQLLTIGPTEWVKSAAEQSPSLAEHEDLLEFLYGRRAGAAVRLLARVQSTDRQPGDLELVRTELDRANWLTRDDAAWALAALGDDSDAQRLLGAALAAIGSTKRDLLHAACGLGGLGIARQLVTSVDPVAADVGARALAADDKTSAAELEALLDDLQPAVRLAAIDGLRLRLDPTEREALLTRYTSRPAYYYNVVSALDRSLYGPSELVTALHT